ncbi:hypothetical protein ACWCSD_30820, partial [Nonomuraea sp. NPDC001684]
TSSGGRHPPRSRHVARPAPAPESRLLLPLPAVESGAANVGAEATGGHTAAPIAKAVLEAVLNK